MTDPNTHDKLEAAKRRESFRVAMLAIGGFVLYFGLSELLRVLIDLVWQVGPGASNPVKIIRMAAQFGIALVLTLAVMLVMDRVFAISATSGRRRMLETGGCPACGYQLSRESGADTLDGQMFCPECGASYHPDGTKVMTTRSGPQ